MGEWVGLGCDGWGVWVRNMLLVWDVGWIGGLGWMGEVGVCWLVGCGGVGGFVGLGGCGGFRAWGLGFRAGQDWVGWIGLGGVSGRVVGWAGYLGG